MSRVQKDTVNYFPHYSDASDRDTLIVLQSRFGNDGYAFWFKLLEKLASTDGHYLDCNNSIKWQLLLAKTGINEITGVEMMNLLVEMQAIDKELWDHKVIWCQKLVDNIADVYKNRRREIPSKPIITGNNPITTDNNGITTDESTQSKLNKSKLKETKEEEIISSNNFSKEDVFEIYKRELAGMHEEESISEYMEGEIEGAINRFSAAWVVDAIREAVKQNKRTWVYVVGILNNWKRYGKNVGKRKDKISQDPDKYVKGKYGHMTQR